MSLNLQLFRRFNQYNFLIIRQNIFEKEHNNITNLNSNSNLLLCKYGNNINFKDCSAILYFKAF